LLIAGTVPGVIAGSTLRVFVATDPDTFRVLAGLVLLPIGTWLLVGKRLRQRTRRLPRDTTTIALALVVGTIAGIYGIGGGSILSPILAGAGMSVSVVAPAALATTFITSCVGALTYALLALTTSGDIAPDWTLGIACGLGRLTGGYRGARLQPRLPESALRTTLGALAAALGVFHLVMGLG
jgi:uncharacterized membrane protein YfcA